MSDTTRTNPNPGDDGGGCFLIFFIFPVGAANSNQVYHIQIKAVTVNVTSTMYTLGISLAASKVEGIGPMRIGQPEPASQTPDNTGLRLKSAASRNGRVPGALVLRQGLQL
jgi:hypothetical protein